MSYYVFPDSKTVYAGGACIKDEATAALFANSQKKFGRVELAKKALGPGVRKPSDAGKVKASLTPFLLANGNSCMVVPSSTKD